VANVEVPFPSPSRRAALLQDALAKYGGKVDPEVDFAALARHFALDPARLEIAARAAIELAAEHEIPVGVRELRESCRHQLRHDLKSLAVRVTNSHKWEDLVIPVDVYDSLREMVIYVRHAERVYDEWGFGARHSLAQGVSALFAGPPGTGKTMCASVMARELDMELFRVDLSRVVSKWIGETEKNLGKIFDEAARSNAIILFDEADALFAKRTEVKSSVDRYANLEINFLLQKMEAFSGITILTTNFEDTLDSAFKRRLTFRMRFEKPDAEARAALWGKVFPANAALAPDLDLIRLGALYELAGGNIRNAAVRAAFLASAAGEPIDMKVCMLAAEREAREMGLLVRSAIEAPVTVSEPVRGRSQNGRSMDLAKAAEEVADRDEPEDKPDAKGKAEKPPRLVPITRRRDRT
jgi:SpoVK/Ycf46/Vps4 family AAA+-type ATPase